MIYDCFTFFNELDLLDIRLNTLNNVVDKFVIVEGTKTFSNLDKKLYFKENRDHFDKFKNKIIHIVVNDYPAYDNAWTYEIHQRNKITEGLVGCAKDDIIIVSDVDEIPNPEKIKEFSNKPGLWKFRQTMYYYYLNNINITRPLWHDISSTMISYSDFKLSDYTPQNLRFSKGKIIKNGGWHFSYLGSPKKISDKIKSFSHQEYNKDLYTNINNIENRISQGKHLFDSKDKYRSMKINNDFPKYILDNINNLQHLTTVPNIKFCDKFKLRFNMVRQETLFLLKKLIIKTK